MKALEAVGVCRRYDRRNVLKDLSLSLEPGEFVALMGPSGSGKSTFLHLAAGLLAADAGTIRVGGTDVTAMGDRAATLFRRRRLGIVFQAFNLLEEKSVEDNVLLPLALESRRLARAPETRRRLESLASRLGLEELLGRSPARLSGGERQRVAIARALIAEPALVLADEPTGNLDAPAAREFCALLKELNATEKAAILLVTHDPVVAATATRVCFLKDGAVALSATTEGDPSRVSRLYLETFGES